MKKTVKIYTIITILILLFTACQREEDYDGTGSASTESFVDVLENITEETQQVSENEEVSQATESQEEATTMIQLQSSQAELESMETTQVQLSEVQTEMTIQETIETESIEVVTTEEVIIEEILTEEATTASVFPVTGTPYEVHGKLSVSGTNLVDANGEAFQLRGVSTHGLSWFPQYVNYDAFKLIRDDWGANAMRLAMYTGEGGYCQGNDTDRQNLVNLIDTGVQAATELGLYIIIDWHILSDSNPHTYADMAADFFEQMSYKYKDYGNVIYEICNEPNGGTSWSDIKSYAERIIPIIKNNCPDAVIIVGTPTWSQDVDIAAGNPITGYSNIMYTLHFYADTHRDGLRNKLVTAINSGLPIMVTEFGICDASGAGANNINEGNTWINTLDSYGISYFSWNLSNKSETSALISSSCQKASGWSESDLSESGKWYRGILQARRDSTVDMNQVQPQGGQTSTEHQTQQSTEETTAQQAQEQTTMAQENINSQPSSEECVATASKSNGWGSEGEVFAQYNVTVSNNGSGAVSGWCVEITFNQNVSISQAWCCSAVAEGNVIKLTPAEYNAVIEAGASRSDIGIIISAATEPVIEKIELK